MKKLSKALTAFACVSTCLWASLSASECRAETATISGEVVEVTAQGWVISAQPGGAKLSMERQESGKGPALPMVNKGDHVSITIDTSMPTQGQQPGRVAPSESPRTAPPGRHQAPGTVDDRSFYNA